MATQTVYGNISELTGSPVTGRERKAGVVFDFTGSYDSTSQRIASRQRAVIDVNGDFEIDLYVNEDGNLVSSYKCTLPSGENFSFVLSGGSQVNLAVLRDSAIFPSGDGFLIIDGQGANEQFLIIDGNE
jgi:hypothetical protein